MAAGERTNIASDWALKRYSYMRMACWLLATMLAAGFFLRPLLTTAPRAWFELNLIYIACFITLPFVFGVERLFALGTCAVSLCGIVIVSTAAKGVGLSTPIMIAVPSLPMIAAFFINARAALFFALVTSVSIVGMGICHVFGWGLSTPAASGDPFLLMRGFLLIISLVIMVFLTILYERQNRRQIELVKSHQDKLLETLAVFQEQTKALEEARTKAEAANEAKSTFLASMSHELRTPLNAVINLSQLALEGDGPPTQRSLETINTSSKGLLQLLNDILDLSRIEADKLSIEEAPFRLDELLEEIVGVFQSGLLETPIEMLVQAPLHVPRALVGDAMRLRQVLLNLLSNAFKFTEAGEIVLRVEWLGGAMSEGGSPMTRLRFSVRDTGVGISPDDKARLFRAFEQLDGSTTRRYGGSGLGLTICQRLLGLMGSSLACESTVGEGSEFSFLVELGVSSNEADELVLPDAASGMTIIVIDPSPLHRKQLLAVFDELLLRGLAMASVEELAALVEAKPTLEFSAVLYGWPSDPQSLREALRTLRPLCRAQDAPVLVMAPTADGGEEKLAHLLGAERFLRKPILPFALVTALDQVLFGAPILTFETHNERRMFDGLFVGAKALLVEDNEANQLVVQSLLQPTGLHLTCVHNGKEGVAQGLAEDFSLILMDIQMPVLDGLEATRQLREEGVTTPIIAMTASVQVGDVAASLEAGMNDYVPKPVAPLDLLWAIAQWLGVAPSAPRTSPLPSQRPALRPLTAREDPLRRAGGVPVEGGHASDLSHFEEGIARHEIPPLPPALIAVVDVDRALLCLGAAWPMFREMLEQLGRQVVRDLPLLEAAMEEDDTTALHRLAHGLAGSAGSLCAIDLFPATRALCDAAKHSSHCRELEGLVKDVRDAIDAYLLGIELLAEIPPDEALLHTPPPFVPMLMIKALDALLGSLTEHDIVLTLNQVEDVRNAALGFFHEQLHALFDASEEFDLIAVEACALELREAIVTDFSIEAAHDA